MTMSSTVQHPASVDAYIRHQWSLVPIPPGSKGPRTTGWNKPGAALRSQADLPPGHGIGLAHAYSGTMALDIDDWATAAPMLAVFGVGIFTSIGIGVMVLLRLVRALTGRLRPGELDMFAGRFSDEAAAHSVRGKIE